MELKFNKLAHLTMPLLLAASLIACDDNDSPVSEVPVPERPIPEVPTPVEPEMTDGELNYQRKDASYDGWGLHIWNDDPTCDGAADSAVTTWDSPLLSTSVGDNGAIYDIPLKPGATCVTYLMHNGNEKEPGGDRRWDINTLGKKVYLTQGNENLSDLPVALAIYESSKGALIDETTVAWKTSGADTYEMHYLPTGGFSINDDNGAITSETIAMVLAEKEMPDGTAKRYEGYQAFSFELPDGISLETLLQGQLVLVAKNAHNSVFDATGLQLAAGLDAIYATGAKVEKLGAVVSGSDATFKLWAPTAKNVALYLYDDNLTQIGSSVAMLRNDNGTWVAEDVTGVVGRYYRYQVTVYHATLDNVETLMVTDPYSLSLSENSLYSQIVDLTVDAKPMGWDDQVIPVLANPEMQVIYETHLRDLTSSPTDGGSSELDGKYTAITETDRKSAIQLAALADNGMNVIHLMNLFDIATVEEDPAKRIELSDTVATFCALNTTAAVCDDGDDTLTLREVLQSYSPETGDAQALMNDLRALDNFNWGYDPFHYTTPEGSYASDAKGLIRITEFRTLVKTLHELGYRVVMDVVYNHTNSAGTDDKSVLDKIVPGYYQRLNSSGFVETSTCCSNTATENAMMGKLMTDSLVTWAEHYKIDGFRFDLMGHQPKQLMVDSLNAVKLVDPDTYFYGEGWNFGEVQDDALFVQATQPNMGGTEIGTFSDRLRDAVRGGGPFDGGDQLRANQGFANAGVWNEMQVDQDASALKLRTDADIIRLGMAGNLANYVLLDQSGATKRGQDVDYNGQKAGYTLDPQENISYVSKHDNQTLWDNNMYKIASSVTSDQRAQMQVLALSTNMLGQGIPFFHMGSELLRSKSMQRDSYDSGDWFNIVNYDMSSNNWNIGLPREDKDGSNWALIKTIIEDSNTEPSMTDIEWADTRFKELLKIRTRSPLFSLKTAADVQARVDFQNTGTDSVNGLIVMSIDDGAGVTDIDPNVDAIVAIINATNVEQVIPVTGASGFTLHDALITGTASFAAGEFTVPALTTAVFVQTQAGAQGTGLAVDMSNKDVTTIPPFADVTPHIIGGMNGWSDANPMLFTSAGIYTTSMTLKAGNYAFKVGNPGWSVVNYGTSGVLVLGEPLALTANAGNISLTLAVDSAVTFRFDANDKVATTLTVTTTEIIVCNVLEDSIEVGPLAFDIYVKGNQSGWGVQPEYQLTYKGNNIYQANFDSDATDIEFKLAGDNWDNNFVLVDGTAVTTDIEQAVAVGAGGEGNNTVSLTNGSWSFLLTLADDATTGRLLVNQCNQ